MNRFILKLFQLVLTVLLLFPSKSYALSPSSGITQSEQHQLFLDLHQINIVLHELNNAVSSVIGHVQLYRRKELKSTEKIEELVSIIEKELTPSVHNVFLIRRSMHGNETRAGFLELKEELEDLRETVIESYALALQIKPETDFNQFSDTVQTIVETVLAEFDKAIFLINFAFKEDDFIFDQVKVAHFLNKEKEGFSQYSDIEFDVQERLDSIVGNEYALSIVIKNLIRNAKYHAKPKKVLVLAYVSEKSWVIEVVNDIQIEDGHVDPYWLEKIIFLDGDEPKKAQRLFALPFSTSKQDGRLHGIGLKLAWGVTSAMGGTIQVESTPGIETRFRVVLPLTGTKLSVTGTGSMRLPVFKSDLTLEEDVVTFSL